MHTYYITGHRLEPNEPAVCDNSLLVTFLLQANISPLTICGHSSMHLGKKHIVFGEVVEPLDALDAATYTDSMDGRTCKEFIVAGSG